MIRVYILNYESIDKLQGGYYETISCTCVPYQEHYSIPTARALSFIIILFSVMEVYI